MRKSTKIIIVGVIIGIGIFTYSQYLLISQVGIEITKNELIEENESGSIHEIELNFTNPSLVLLTGGKTEFFITADEKLIGKGILEPFVLPILGKGNTSGTYQKDLNSKSSDEATVKITGVTKYDVFFTTLDVPFVFYPSPEQAREFIG